MQQQLNQLELQNLREIIGAHDTAQKKLSTYAEQCQDPEVKQSFQQAARSAQSTMQKLMGFL